MKFFTSLRHQPIQRGIDHSSLFEMTLASAISDDPLISAIGKG